MRRWGKQAPGRAATRGQVAAMYAVMAGARPEPPRLDCPRCGAQGLRPDELREAACSRCEKPEARKP